MKTRLGIFSLLAWMCLGCGAWAQQAPLDRNDKALQTVVVGYARESMSDTMIVGRFTQLSGQGDPRATLWLARLNWGGRCGLQAEPGIAYDLAEPVMEQVVKLAEGGDHEAQFLVGSCHQEGFVLKRSPADAAKWYAKAVEGKQLAAYGNLALILAEGEGVEADIEQARNLWKEGAGLGSRSCRIVQPQYAPPDSKSISRLREVRRNKVVQALGLKTEAAVRMLAEAGVITQSDPPIDFMSGSLSCLEFEDDGIVIDSNVDGIVRCIDVYRASTSSDHARGGIPFGIAWNDQEKELADKMGARYGRALLREQGARISSYQAGNIMFSVAINLVEERAVKFWRVREMWHEDFPSEK